ncbi:hypothetical protein HN51_048205, partial [Arachis hypogaea]
ERTDGWLCVAVVEGSSISATSSNRAPLSLSRSCPPFLPCLAMTMTSAGTATVSINGSGATRRSMDGGHRSKARQQRLEMAATDAVGCSVDGTAIGQ